MLITFVGGGNMATALISGLRHPPDAHLRLRVVDPNPEARHRLETTFEIETFDLPMPAIAGADVIVLAIKPQNMPTVLSQLQTVVRPEQLLLSIAAGTTIARIKQACGARQAVIRSMPNTPALIGHGITGVYADENCSSHHLAQAERILCATGEVVWVSEEALLDAVTAISGSGPAYFFLLTEALAAAARELGLSGETADRLAAQTCFGAGAMVANNIDDVAGLRRRVTSPGGTTEAAMVEFREGRFTELVLRAVTRARDRSRELAGDGS
ncbi:MAG: pyrroline-5-carboxylate reductase [Xanthomonadales bacterium]|nr:pyrroline-5-carboxylate reductase [Xanthomonadales bacterium]